MKRYKIERLHFISQETQNFTHQECILKALNGGVKWIQLRVKNKSDDEVYAIASEVKKMCGQFEDVTFIINDYLSIAKELDLDGIHLGMTDTSTLVARHELGDHKIVGGTANTLEDIMFHYKNGVNYVGFGPYSHTLTKKNLSPILGTEGFKSVLEALNKKSISVPIIAIGGIEKEDIKNIAQLGVHGIALASLINLDKSPTHKSNEILQEIKILWKN